MKKRIIIISIISIIAIVIALLTRFVFIPQSSSGRDDANNNEKTDYDIDLILGEKVVEYFVDDDFIKPKIYAEYSDGTIINVTESEGLTIDGYDMSKSGAYYVNIKYVDGELSGFASYKINVYSASPKYLTAKYSGGDIFWGEKIDTDLLEVKLIYTNYKIKILSNDDYILRYNPEPDSYGPVEVTVLYDDLSTSFTVNYIGKNIDSKYSNIISETERILGLLGISNPSCPKDYDFTIKVDGSGITQAKGVLKGYNDSNKDDLYIYLGSYVFMGYTFISGPTESYDTIFPSLKTVFRNESKNTEASFYVLPYSSDYNYALRITSITY